ncbi:OLC1v1032569C1 [Oldenlandia corymbosa var. corymbosa]|uniref:OLC1v1032569C1 n=1 Tax=Oldenlandia corymbosa var. corymbosa TaxID=529605 RepID=A0AAV1CPA8_OLDCO|nr:OLC1v1032569C1 [Oldenlandia corymbosa var. corymbosa]
MLTMKSVKSNIMSHDSLIYSKVDSNYFHFLKTNYKSLLLELEARIGEKKKSKVFEMGSEAESLISNLMVKIKEMVGDFGTCENIIQGVKQSLMSFFLMIQNLGLFIMVWLDNVFPPETRTVERMAGRLVMIVEIIRAKFKEMGADEMVQFLLEKSKVLFLIVENSVSFSVSWLGEVFPPETRNLKGVWVVVMKTTEITRIKLKEIGADEMIYNLGQKLNKVLFWMMEKLGSILMALLGRIFPPETRKERIRYWILVGGPYAAVAVLLIMVLIVFGNCSSKKGEKMMKAPGREFRMPRRDFEANPKGYFHGIRGNKHKKC